jgi:hypothetical protein
MHDSVAVLQGTALFRAADPILDHWPNHYQPPLCDNAGSVWHMVVQAPVQCELLVMWDLLC